MAAKVKMNGKWIKKGKMQKDEEGRAAGYAPGAARASGEKAWMEGHRAGDTPPSTWKFLRNHSSPEREDTRDNPSSWHKYGPSAAIAAAKEAWMKSHKRPKRRSK